jgi:hypothetical protein
VSHFETVDHISHLPAITNVESMETFVDTCSSHETESSLELALSIETTNMLNSKRDERNQANEIANEGIS